MLTQIEYACIVYNGLNQGDSEFLQKIQNSALRSILHQNARTPIADLHTEAGLGMLADRRQVQVCQYVYKGVNGESTPFINNMFSGVRSVRERPTRAATRGDLVIPQCTWKSPNGVCHIGAHSILLHLIRQIEMSYDCVKLMLRDPC